MGTRRVTPEGDAVGIDAQLSRMLAHVAHGGEHVGCHREAVKPLPHGFFLARWRMRSRRANTVVIGDQTFTDILGAHFVGLKGLLVTPLATQDLVHTRILRKLDRVFLWGLKPQGGPPAFTADEGAEALL